MVILKMYRYALILICLGVLSSCSETKQIELPKTQFTHLAAEETGIDFSNIIKEDIFTHENVLTFEYYYNGGGVGIADFNNDGLQDVILTGNSVSNRIYLNKGEMRFEDVSETSGILSKKYWTNGVALADVNGDGYVDIYCSNGGAKLTPGERQNQLFINNGDMTFTEKAKEYGIDDGNFSVQSSFFDYDNDGDLDLFVMNHTIYQRKRMKDILEIMKNEQKVDAGSCHLYRNDGNKFTDVTQPAGLFQLAYGLGLVTVDINEDGLIDIYVANDYSIPDAMYINNGDGTFTDEIKQRTKQIAWFAMGCDIADINNDGHDEIAVVDMATSDHIRGKTLMASMNPQAFRTYVEYFQYQYQYMFNAFQVNNGNGTFNNVANMLGVAKTDWSWATLLVDFDNDRQRDYFVTNGYRRYTRDNDFRVKMKQVRDANGGSVPDNLKQGLWDQIPEVKLPNYMYHNLGNLAFADVAKDWGMGQATYSNGAAYGDLDNDGDLDLVINNIDQESFVYRNNTAQINANNYLRIHLIGKDVETFNTRVALTIGEEKLTQELTPVRGFQSSVEPILHFGLGDVSQIDKIVITWPDGKVQEESVLMINALNEVSRNPAKFVDKPFSDNTDPIFTAVNPNELGINYTHKENKFNDFEKEILLPHSQSRLGPFTAVADVNNDGLDDFYVGGAKGQPGQMYLQQSDGTFSFKNGSWMKDYQCEDMDALFFDADGDNDLDLYVVSGGGGDVEGNPALWQDRLYINYGGGDFVKSNALPKMLTSGMKVSANDFDQDGDLDLVVTGRTMPGQYPLPPRSYLLENQGRKFIDITSSKAPDLDKIGMVADMVWSDFSGDGIEDLIVVGEWMEPAFFQNKSDSLVKVASPISDESKSGWWNSIAVADIDNDGDDDYILGNIGLNTKFTPKPNKPLGIYANDFDETGTLDIVISKDYKGKEVPLRGRQCSSDQMPNIKEKFPTYGAFAKASLQDIYTEEKLAEGIHFSANNFESIVLLNNGGTFQSIPLPRVAQVSPINRVLIEDVNADGKPDLIIGGNMYQTEVETPRYDAGNGLLLLGNGDGTFVAITSQESGINLPHDAKDMEWLTIKDHQAIMVTNNNRPLQIFKRP